MLFLSISAFVFSIAVAIIDSAEFIDPGAVLRGFTSRAKLDISITQLLFTIFPIFLWVWLLAWAGRLLVADNHRRKQVSRYFCYIFGFFGAGFFLWFLANSLVLFDYVQRRDIWLQHRRLDALRVFVSVSFLTFVVVQPFSLSVVTIWRLTRAEVVLKRIFKSALGLLLLAAMIIGSIFIQGIPRRLNEAIAEPAKPPKEAPIKFANWPQGLHNMPDIEFDGADHLLIKFRIVAANPRDTTVFLDRTMILQLFANESKPISLYLYVNESFESTDPLTLLAKDSRLINCQGQLERREYQEMAGRKVRFAILASWYDLTKGGLERNSDWILDDEGYILDFKQVTEPKLKVEKSKKKP